MTIKSVLGYILAAAALLPATAVGQNVESNLQSEFAKKAVDNGEQRVYVPTEENLQARKEFEKRRFGIFIHWGFYSMPGQGEWVLTRSNVPFDEYVELASGFYPSKFNAKDWIDLFKEAGAKYMVFTTRHHDGFSMFDSKYTDYDIVDATPFKRDVLKELADECHKQDFGLNLYYSHVDWYRDDYPTGWSANEYPNLKKHDDVPYEPYYNFMNNQLTELLTNYGKIGGIWFDGVFDHRRDSMDWHFPEQFDLVHKLQPACLIANNHHRQIQYGEDFQIFERDLPGENKSGFGTAGGVSELPLETCQQIVNGSWGYHVNKMNCKSPVELINTLVATAGKGANLLLNIGPRPNGSIPGPAAESLRGLGKWISKYGETIYETDKGDISGAWGSSTRKGDRLFLHITHRPGDELYLPLGCKVKSAKMFIGGAPMKFDQWKHGIQLQLPEATDGEPVMVIELVTAGKIVL